MHVCLRVFVAVAAALTLLEAQGCQYSCQLPSFPGCQDQGGHCYCGNCPEECPCAACPRGCQYASVHACQQSLCEDEGADDSTCCRVNGSRNNPHLTTVQATPTTTVTTLTTTITAPEYNPLVCAQRIDAGRTQHILGAKGSPLASRTVDYAVAAINNDANSSSLTMGGRDTTGRHTLLYLKHRRDCVAVVGLLNQKTGSSLSCLDCNVCTKYDYMEYYLGCSAGDAQALNTHFFWTTTTTTATTTTLTTTTVTTTTTTGAVHSCEATWPIPTFALQWDRYCRADARAWGSAGWAMTKDCAVAWSSALSVVLQECRGLNAGCVLFDSNRTKCSRRVSTTRTATTTTTVWATPEVHATSYLTPVNSTRPKATSDKLNRKQYAPTTPGGTPTALNGNGTTTTEIVETSSSSGTMAIVIIVVVALIVCVAVVVACRRKNQTSKVLGDLAAARRATLAREAEGSKAGGEARQTVHNAAFDGPTYAEGSAQFVDEFVDEPVTLYAVGSATAQDAADNAKEKVMTEDGETGGGAEITASPATTTPGYEASPLTRPDTASPATSAYEALPLTRPDTTTALPHYGVPLTTPRVYEEPGRRVLVLADTCTADDGGEPRRGSVVVAAAAHVGDGVGIRTLYNVPFDSRV